MFLQLLLNKKNQLFILILISMIKSFALQLGDGTDENRNIPVFIDNNVSKVSSGTYHTLYLKNNVLYGVGDNSYYQLGNSEKTEYSSPIKIDKNVIYAEAGDFTTFYIKRDGTLWACGYLPEKFEVQGNKSKLLFKKNSKPVCIDKNVISISACNSFMYIKKDHTLWGFGENSYGQLGIGTTKAVILPTKIMDNVIQVFSSNLCTLIINTDNELFQTNSEGVFCHIDKNVSFISNQMYIKTDKSLWGYGFPYYGALGIGKQNDMVQTPVLIMKGVKEISSDPNQNHTLIINENNELYVCGGSSHENWGQLGLGNNEIQYYPIFLCSDVKHVSAGNCYSHFIKLDSSLWAMGLNNRNTSGL